MSPVATAAGLVAFPVAAGAVGAAVAAIRRPGPRLTSAVQHFAAGVVFAAVAGEVLPDLRSEGRLPAVVVGFGLGVALLLGLAAWSRRMESGAEDGTAGSNVVRLPVGLLAAVGIDLLIDGSLVGLGATLGSNQGVILTIALTLEILFLGVSVCVQLLDRGVGRRKAATVSALLGVATAAGALLSALLLGDANKSVLAGVLAFGAAALLYLVVEELLVEAHEQAETAVLSAAFFLGFLILFVLAEIGG
jgi:ZIP family zinc transporter